MKEKGLDNDLKTISLRGFQKLKTLRCQYEMICPNEDGIGDSDSELGATDELPKEVFDIRTVLPVSLESLYIDCGDSGAWDKIKTDLQDHCKLLPNLKRVWMKYSWQPQGRESEWSMGDASDFEKKRLFKNPLMSLLDGHGAWGDNEAEEL
jgi:hypothetical protein